MVRSKDPLGGPQGVLEWSQCCSPTTAAELNRKRKSAAKDDRETEGVKSVHFAGRRQTEEEIFGGVAVALTLQIVVPVPVALKVSLKQKVLGNQGVTVAEIFGGKFQSETWPKIYCSAQYLKQFLNPQLTILKYVHM